MSLLANLPSPRLTLSDEDLTELCRRFNVQELAVFGSVLRDDFQANSDVDFLVTFQNNDVGPWMSNLTGLEESLTRLLGRKADVVDKPSIEQSENYIRRKHILQSARVLYVA